VPAYEGFAVGDPVAAYLPTGGIGSAAAQLARALGAKAVYGTVGSAAVEAHERMQAGAVQGKLLLQVAEDLV
jgi:NADPH:quinone reductase-like Zn-dependent oxidoreductase